MKARQKPKPYRVYYLDYGFLEDFRNIQFMTSLQSRKKIGDPLLTDIRALHTPTPDISVFYKLKHPDNSAELNFSRWTKKIHIETAYPLSGLHNFFDSPIPIRKKYLHL